MTEVADGLKITAVAERTGVGVHTLRAWERRYGIPAPARSIGGQRLYSETDVSRVRRVLALMSEGLAPAQAAARVLAEGRAPAVVPGRDEVDALYESLAMLDERSATAAWNWLVDRHDAATLVEQCLVPVLARIGRQWEDGEVSIDQEHFASAFLASRVSGLARQASPPDRPVAVLACPEGERHDLSLHMASLLIRYGGVNTIVLGANTPAEAIVRAVRVSGAEVLLISAFSEETAAAGERALRAVAHESPGVAVIVGGPGFRQAPEPEHTRARPAACATTLAQAVELVRQAAWGHEGGYR